MLREFRGGNSAVLLSLPASFRQALAEVPKTRGQSTSRRIVSVAQSQAPLVPRSLTRISLTYTDLELPHSFWCSR